MQVKKIPFDAIVTDKKLNPRAYNEEHAKQLSDSIEAMGLEEPLKCVQILKAGSDGGSEEVIKVFDGFHRVGALKMLRKRSPERFSELFPGEKVPVIFKQGDADILHDTSVTLNAQRLGLQPHEIYSEVIRTLAKGKDQRDAAVLLGLQQPRVAEYASFQKCLPEVHTAWRDGKLSHNDMISFAALDPDAQITALEAFIAGVAAEGGKKAPARKELKKKAREAGSIREYANAGKPTRKSIAQYTNEAYVHATDSPTVAERNFWNAVAAAFKVINGEIEFRKLAPGKSFVKVGESKAASAALEAAAEKAAAKAAAEKAAAKAEKDPATDTPKAAKKAQKAQKAKKAKKAKKASDDSDAAASSEGDEPKKAAKSKSKNKDKAVTKSKPNKAAQAGEA